MREIEFRGKTAKGEWVYGYYVHNTYAVGFAKEPTLYENHYIYSKNFISESWFNTAKVEVVPETVGQFTGLTDKNGKKIFEGDIVKVTVCSSYDCYVRFKDYAWYFVPFDEKVKEVKFGVLKHADYEVIGTVFDKESDNGD